MGNMHSSLSYQGVTFDRVTMHDMFNVPVWEREITTDYYTIYLLK